MLKEAVNFKEEISFKITFNGFILLLLSLLLFFLGLYTKITVMLILSLVPNFLFIYFMYNTYRQKHEKLVIEIEALSNQVKAKGFYLLSVKLYKKQVSNAIIRGFFSVITSDGLFPVTPANTYFEMNNAVTQNFLFYAPKRGKEYVKKIVIQENGLFNFFTVHHVITINKEVFVLPENQRVSLPWTVKQRIMENFLSEISVPIRGKGTDFLALKEFEFGDEIRHIHWKATAKFQKLISKEFQELKQIRFLIVVDNNSYMAGPKLEFALSSVIELMSALRRFHHRYYIIVHNEKLDRFIAMGNTPQSLASLELSLYNIKPTGLEFNYKKLMDEILAKKLIDTVMIIITDLEKPPENLKKEIMHLKPIWHQLFFFALYTPGFGSMAVTKIRETTQYNSNFAYYRRYGVEELLELKYRKIIQEYKDLITSVGGNFQLVQTYETNILLELEEILRIKRKQLANSRAAIVNVPDTLSFISLFRKGEKNFKNFSFKYSKNITDENELYKSKEPVQFLESSFSIKLGEKIDKGGKSR